MTTVSGFNVVEGDGAGNLTSDSAALTQAITYLNTSTNGQTIISQATAEGATISFNRSGDDSYNSMNNTINWDPTSAAAVLDDTNGAAYGVQSAALGLVHEADHANDYWNNPAEYMADQNTPSDDYDNLEEQNAVLAEDRVANDLGETQRFKHEIAGTGEGIPPDGTVVEADSTEHTTTNASGSDVWVSGNSTNSLGTYELGTVPGAVPTGGGDTGNGNLSVTQSDITVTPNQGDNVDVLGVNDTIVANNSSIGFGSNGAESGSGNSVFVGSGSTVSVDGDSNSIQTTGGTIDLSGSGNSVGATLGTININAPGTTNNVSAIFDTTLNLDAGGVSLRGETTTANLVD